MPISPCWLTEEVLAASVERIDRAATFLCGTLDLLRVQEPICACNQERWVSEWVVWSPGMTTVPCSRVPRMPARDLLGFRDGTICPCTRRETKCSRGTAHPSFLCHLHWLIGDINPAFLIQLESCNTKIMAPWKAPWKKPMFNSLTQALILLHNMKIVHAARCARSLSVHAWIIQSIFSTLVLFYQS